MSIKKNKIDGLNPDPGRSELSRSAGRTDGGGARVRGPVRLCPRPLSSTKVGCPLGPKPIGEAQLFKLIFIISSIQRGTASTTLLTHILWVFTNDYNDMYSPL